MNEFISENWKHFLAIFLSFGAVYYAGLAKKFSKNLKQMFGYFLAGFVLLSMAHLTDILGHEGLSIVILNEGPKSLAEHFFFWAAMLVFIFSLSKIVKKEENNINEEV